LFDDFFSDAGTIGPVEETKEDNSFEGTLVGLIV